MVKVQDYEVREELYYTKNHEWVKIEDGKARIGISDYAQKTLHEIVYADLPPVGDKVKQSSSFGTVESVKAVAEVYAPISVEVEEVNTKILDSPELCNKSPYEEGWIAIIKASNLEEELKNLMNAQTYAVFLREVIEK